MNNPLENLYSRQTGIVAPEKLDKSILIVGAGSIGSWTALALLKLGCQNVSIMDFDTVEEQNAGSQIYKLFDTGQAKVGALRDKLRMLTEWDITPINERWTPEFDLEPYDIIISAVDNITVRKELYQKLKDTKKIYIDGRMASNAIEIYTVNCESKEDQEKYAETLFEESETIPVPCSERAVVYNVFIVAGLLTDLVGKIVNEEELPKEIVVDLKNFFLYT